MVTLSFKEISSRLKSMDLPDFDVVVGIGSGGIPAATMLAYHMGAELFVMGMNYRDENNTPVHKKPKLLYKPEWDLADKRILLVDDVSVSGKTMEAAKAQLKEYTVTTLAMKGKADYVLFPEIKDCVKWPWKE
jgi:hypoxanthine phosphoribosyltransferase